MADRLSNEEIGAELGSVAWQRDGDAIVLERKFKDFAEAMAYVNRVADAAEAADHHPDILVHGWNGVRLTLYTHTVEGLTAADFAMARTIDELG
jgi:4a-hydroxytetrahydrobiopterin dehydratase